MSLHEWSKLGESKDALLFSQLIMTKESPKIVRRGIPKFFETVRRAQREIIYALVLVLMPQPKEKPRV